MKSLNKPVMLFDLDYTLFNVDVFKQSGLTNFAIYDEVEETLENLKDNYVLGVFSEGEVELQKSKLKNTGIKKYFKDENVHIVENKPASVANVLNKYNVNNIFYVEDKLNVLFDAKKLTPSLFAIWMKRGRYAQNQKDIPGFKPDAEIENLKEVVRITQLEMSS